MTIGEEVSSEELWLILSLAQLGGLYFFGLMIIFGGGASLFFAIYRCVGGGEVLDSKTRKHLYQVLDHPYRAVIFLALAYSIFVARILSVYAILKWAGN